MKINYQREGDYLLPELTIEQPQQPLGKYGLLRKEYLKRRRRAFYNQLLIKGELLNHLMQVEYEAQEELERLEKLFAQAENLSEELKASDLLAWISKKNYIKKQAEELVLEQIIFA